jgi:hypothetical protein
VINLLAVQAFQCAEQRVHQRPEPGLIWRPLQGTTGLIQGLPLVAGHHHIGGATLFPEPDHPHQRRMIEPCQQARLVDKGAQAQGKGLFMLWCPQNHRTITAPRGQRRRQVLLDGHRALQCSFRGSIDEPEPTNAQQAVDVVIHESGADRQGVGCGRSHLFHCRSLPQRSKLKFED